MAIHGIDQSSLSPLQRQQFRQAPDTEFFDRFKSAYARYRQQPSDPSASSVAKAESDGAALSSLMGLTFTEMAAIRGTRASDQKAYADILNRAYGNGGMEDPVSFLKSLDAGDLSAVQRVHGLADTINPGTISKEGAYNLLLPTGYRVDFNRDGIEEVGAAKTISFPPLDAPEQVKQAWLTATKDMNERDAAIQQLHMHHMLYGTHIDGHAPSAKLPTDRIDSYKNSIDNYLARLEATKAQLPKGQYQRDKAFFGEMKRLLA